MSAPGWTTWWSSPRAISKKVSRSGRSSGRSTTVGRGHHLAVGRVSIYLVELSSPFAVSRMAYKPATRYAEQQTRPGASDSRVHITRLAVRWLHTVEAEKPIQLCGRPERVEPMAQPATSLTRRPVFICEGQKSERRDDRRALVKNRRIRQRKKDRCRGSQREAQVHTESEEVMRRSKL